MFPNEHFTNYFKFYFYFVKYFCYSFDIQTLEEIKQTPCCSIMQLKEIRTKKGLSVPQLVDISGVPRRTIQDIEKRDDCRVSTAIILADALEVTLDELCRNLE